MRVGSSKSDRGQEAAMAQANAAREQEHSYIRNHSLFKDRQHLFNTGSSRKMNVNFKYKLAAQEIHRYEKDNEQYRNWYHSKSSRKSLGQSGQENKEKPRRKSLVFGGQDSNDFGIFGGGTL